MSRGPRSHAEGDRECRCLLGIALQLGLLHPAVAPPRLVHREEAARGLVDVHGRGRRRLRACP